MITGAICKTCGTDHSATNGRCPGLFRKPEWNGEGLPPVGCECEVAQPGQVNWSGFKVIAVNAGAVFGFWDNGVPSALDSDRWSFRPSLTEAQLKREEIANALNEELGDIEKYHTWKEALISVYDLVAAGKIPHITLK